ncbi:RNA polymerase factor sigma-70 [Chitinimonas lacunae]|uniref:RNA polymerase factor sigma-70 n=1 Tax=Chitinimonas lacunae TaxID=1963018 RepID=A0ABV8MPW4_9NEIS
MYPGQETVSPVLRDAFIHHRRALVDAAARIVGCRWRAEELTQDAFIKLSELDMAQPIERPLHYLFRMVRNHAIDSARRAALESRYHEPGDEEEIARLTGPWPSPENRLIQRETLAMLERALNRLPERTRHAFALHRIDGETQKSVAAQLGVSPTLVNFMIRDAHLQCQTALACYESGMSK